MIGVNLDDLAAYQRVDTADMMGHIRALSGQCVAAWQLVQEVSLPQDFDSVRHIVVVGIGGSAMGATAVQGLVAGECTVPISVARDYALPAYVQGAEFLVVGSSYSGNTEETLSAMGQALERGARTVAITTGGGLADMARREGMSLLSYEYRSQPRAALGYSLILLLGLCSRLGFVRDYRSDVVEATQVMDAWRAEIDAPVGMESNEAKTLAIRIANRLPVVYGAGHLVAVANRWKTQFNENAKYWSYFEAMPELQHNAVVGFDSEQPAGKQTLVLMLRSNLDHPRVQTRWDVTEEMLAGAGVGFEIVQARGKSRLAQMLSLIQYGDFVSYYLALLAGRDPTPVDAIGYLKARLGEER